MAASVARIRDGDHQLDEAHAARKAPARRRLRLRLPAAQRSLQRMVRCHVLGKVPVGRARQDDRVVAGAGDAAGLRDADLSLHGIARQADDVGRPAARRGAPATTGEALDPEGVGHELVLLFRRAYPHREFGLDLAELGFHEARRFFVVRVDLRHVGVADVAPVERQRHRGQDAGDRQHDHQFYQCETRPALHDLRSPALLYSNGYGNGTAPFRCAWMTAGGSSTGRRLACA